MRFHALLLGTLMFSCATFAQEVTAGIYGTVLDSSASAVPRASITLRNIETGRRLSHRRAGHHGDGARPRENVNGWHAVDHDGSGRRGGCGRGTDAPGRIQRNTL